MRAIHGLFFVLTLAACGIAPDEAAVAQDNGSSNAQETAVSPIQPHYASGFVWLDAAPWYATDIIATVEVAQDTCAPDCESKQCGPNGCGGVCGACAFSKFCTCNGSVESCAIILGTCTASGLCATTATDNIPCTDEKLCTMDLCLEGQGCVFLEKADCCETVDDCKVYEGPDYAGTCENNYCVPSKTCTGQCGYTFSAAVVECYCDDVCFAFGDCCPHICAPEECADTFATQCAESNTF